MRRIFDIDSLITLDPDLTEHNSICKMVKTYEYAWWKERKPQDFNQADILDKLTLDICYKTHITKLLDIIQIQSYFPFRVLSNPPHPLYNQVPISPVAAPLPPPPPVPRTHSRPVFPSQQQFDPAYNHNPPPVFNHFPQPTYNQISSPARPC